MQQAIAIADIKRRAEAVNLTLQGLAKRAGVRPSTAWRAKRRGDARLSTVVRLTSGLLAEERRLYEHLATLYGDPREGRPCEPRS